MAVAQASQEFFRFLGTEGGALLRHSVEALLLLLITYMVLSEHRRAPQRHLKYLVWAFLALAVQRLYVSLFLAANVFGPAELPGNLDDLYVLFHALELLGLILIGCAFLYPAFAEPHRFRRLLAWQLVPAAALIAILLVLWFTSIRFLGPDARTPFLVLSTELPKLAVLGATTWLLLAYRHKWTKYFSSTVLAFGVYALGSLLGLANLLLSGYHSRELRILALPFPFFGILLFTRAIYLKLVDKAAMRHQLAVAEAKLSHTQEVSKLKDEFLSIVGHELRTPLTSMNLYSSLLLDEKMGQLTPQQKEAIAVLKAEIQRLSALINDLLDLSKLESRKVKLRLEAVNLHDLAERSSHRALAEQKRIAVKNAVPRGLTVQADPDKLAQVVVNLVSNAIKFTPEGGTITISGRANGKSWELSVADTGPGIPKDKQKRLFDKFYQVDDYLTRERGGVGLGLAIVRSLVELHRGKITVKSEEGRGSAFTVSVPQKRGGRRPF